MKKESFRIRNCNCDTSCKKAQIPTPEFIIFYNGEEERPERETLKLSDLYTLQEKGGKSEEEDYRLELKAELLNIGGDNNKALKNACRTLREYAVFTDKMRKYTKTMDIFEYDQEKHIRQEREQAWEEGRETGLAEGEKNKLKELIQKNSRKGKHWLR